ncbi:agmatinase [Archaeoglobus profundus]|uniref:Agmatinase n=1 Tax=Archaeoglobus profundus (strain DSM 5631 / JCM 9629 / NBRC 100127 / Av18) TaxID=572546 RepID=D2RDG6_ARCPA|nr:agmatinase [Archaeoglobus profundus]ADB58160.1 agmatinase [Archaeoglobus profundus DSM 5631]
MHIDSFFSLSNSDLDSAEFVVAGIPYDRSQSFLPGSRFAPNAIRIASWNLESYSSIFDVDLDLLRICDAGNINVDGDFNVVLKNVENFVSKVKDKVLISLGGEHTVSYAVVRALGNDFCYLVIDAHLDLRESFDNDPYNHACTCRRISELGIDIIYLGARSYTKEELEFARYKNFKIFKPFNFKIDELEDVLSSYDKVYLSIDVDGFDPSFAPGVSTPEPFGLNPTITLEIFRRFSEKIVAMDLVEVVPDDNYVTPMLCARIIFEFLASKSLSSTEKL